MGGNICVECRKRDGGKHVISQLIIVAFSLGLLTFFTVMAMSESVDIVLQCQGKGPMEDVDDDVNGWITLSFALAGIAFDLACMIEFYKSGKRSEAARALNMFTALLHVGADFLRSSSTLVMSLLILVGGFDSICLDAYTSLLIGTLIIGGACVGAVQTARLAHAYFFAPQEETQKMEEVV